MAWTGQTFTVGQILTAAQMNNLQGDITSLANGDAGSPRIQNAALDPTIQLTAANIRPHVFPVVLAGNMTNNESGGVVERTTTSKTPVLMFQYRLLAHGTFRIGAQLANGSSGQTTYMRVYRNGVAVGSTLSVTGQTFTVRSIDIAGWVALDILQIYLWVSDSSGRIKFEVVQTNVPAGALGNGRV